MLYQRTNVCMNTGLLLKKKSKYIHLCYTISISQINMRLCSHHLYLTCPGHMYILCQDHAFPTYTNIQTRRRQASLFSHQSILTPTNTNIHQHKNGGVYIRDVKVTTYDSTIQKHMHGNSPIFMHV